MGLSQRQIEYLKESKHSFNIAAGAVSSGKTYAQILRWYKHIYDCPDGALLLMSGKTHESLYDNVIRDLQKINPGDIKVRRQPLRIQVLSKGIEIACADAHNERSWGRVQGKTVYGWLADEVTQHPRNFVLMAISRCRGDGQVWPKFWTCNPDVPTHYVKTDFIDNDQLNSGHWHFILSDNPVNTQEYIDEVSSTYTGVFYDRYILGKWVLAEGIVYPGFNYSVHIYKDRPIPSAWSRYRSIDFGYTNPFVCLFGAVDHDGRLYIYDEHYEAKRLIGYHQEHVKRYGNESLAVADHDAQERAELREHGINTKAAKKDVTLGIQRVSERLVVQPDGYPRLFISSRCKNLIREFGLYRWAEVKEGVNEKEEPIKDNDHAMDALRYLVMELDHNPGSVGYTEI